MVDTNQVSTNTSQDAHASPPQATLNNPSPSPSSDPLPASSSPVANAHDTSQSPRLLSEQPVQNASPEVVALRSMFPDYDDAILHSVLESVGGNQDHAIDALLGMSDPNYTSEARSEEPQLSQTELDEQLARRLMLEDQEEQQRQWQQQQRSPAVSFQSAPYQARQQQQQPYQGPPAGGERDTMAEFQDQFNKFAETGKKTLGNLFSKVKSKIQEFDQPRPGQGTQPTWGSSGGAFNATQSSPPQQGYYPNQQSPVPSQSQTAYYDPNSPMIAQSPSPPPRTSVSNLQGYDVTPNSSRLSAVGGSGQTTQPQGFSSPSRQPAPIDGGKLGLLPKRPVSLVRDPSATQPQSKPDEDDDGLEYTENPFEDSRK
ncbi:hypothetical protein BDQ17DRAFT_1420983 [Cyathus striatus]|nr:hypothetical protein BDQ17DRAFT_1420983 [Cyathus striatus]